ncbi:MAG TPA: hypothetical protein VN704_03730 [Verrucomicrobiae bacterium]|jgi:hypothetical protein|nr:hypothetical protein [Verrucomicrobiae bacterium]
MQQSIVDEFMITLEYDNLDSVLLNIENHYNKDDVLSAAKAVTYVLIAIKVATNSIPIIIALKLVFTIKYPLLRL